VYIDEFDAGLRYCYDCIIAIAVILTEAPSKKTMATLEMFRFAQHDNELR